jgi:hypothetical protein
MVHEADEACVLCPEQHFCPLTLTTPQYSVTRLALQVAGDVDEILAVQPEI